MLDIPCRYANQTGLGDACTSANVQQSQLVRSFNNTFEAIVIHDRGDSKTFGTLVARYTKFFQRWESRRRSLCKKKFFFFVVAEEKRNKIKGLCCQLFTCWSKGTVAIVTHEFVIRSTRRHGQPICNSSTCSANSACDARRILDRSKTCMFGQLVCKSNFWDGSYHGCCQEGGWESDPCRESRNF